MKRYQPPFSLILTYTLLATLLAGCLFSKPQNTARKVATKESSTTITTTPGVGTPVTPTPDSEAIYWYAQGKVVGTITLNRDQQTVVYLRGNQINTFLNANSNFSKNFCLVVEYNLSLVSVVKQLRLRAVPLSLTNFSTASRERILQVDVALPLESASTCAGTVGGVSGGAQVVYQIADVCPNCANNPFGSISIKLYQSSSNLISDAALVSNTLVETTGLGLRINPVNDTQDPSSSCTNSVCRAKGFDCCLDGQCIKDGREKPGVQTLPHYSQAIADVRVSPNNFIYWPDIFYICPGNALPTPSPGPTPDVVATAQAELEILKPLYFCLKEGSLSPPSYINCQPEQSLTSFNEVKNSVWLICECATVGTPAPEDPAATCPQYGLTAYDDKGAELKDLTISQASQIRSISCLTPGVIQTTPLQILNFKLPSRSVPHRFFRSGETVSGTPAGMPVPDISLLFGTPETDGPLSEGVEFRYLDESAKSQAENGKFNMNSILGQMRVDLSAALPAKKLDVELDQTYVISTVSGNYSPCPMCPRDAWFTAFTAHPPSRFGTGLQAIGHTTSRDSFSTNLTTGNYEDTIFGRACWIPPTMIPFSHKSRSTVQEQRLARLQTQSALYINGYQRDWYGFNKGAVIGSFDGVKWFAIGKTRRVRATSNQLFLAINAPFGDLADYSEMTLQIIQDDGTAILPVYDFNPDLTERHVQQNEGGTCQAYHQCEKDADCIAQLGWEYMCANISPYKTLWPRFTSAGLEVANSSLTLGYNNVIYGDTIPGGSMRCVYRGAGAPCQKNYSTIPDKNLRKLFTCAPNFYCASVSGGTGSSDFNSELVRDPNSLAGIIFGHGAKVLGRPLKYINAGQTLDATTVVPNLQANGALKLTSLNNMGLCRPGKNLGLIGSQARPQDSHSAPDVSRRTDYINQIGSCNSAASGFLRVHTCPLLDDNGNYYYVDAVGGLMPSTNSASEISFYQTRFKAQNSCGNESQDVDGHTPFEAAEAGPLEGLLNLNSPTVAKDACFRRAGSICHTDLDCSPNLFHAEQTKLFDVELFGDTLAEKRYWEESLICAQGKELPLINTTSTASQADYKLKDNRCCRAIGQSLTMYTAGDPATEKSSDSLNLRTTSPFAIDNPRSPARYSRYTVLESLSSTDSVAGTTVPLVKVETTNLARPLKYQWRTFHETGRKTCCGGTWIRKFADGTHNWLVSNRLNFNVENFRCLNFRTPLFSEEPTNLQEVSPKQNVTYTNEYDFLCRDPKYGGCVHWNMTAADGFSIVPPSNINFTDSNSALVGSNLTSSTTSVTLFPFAVFHSENRTYSDPETRTNVLINDFAPYNPRAAQFPQTWPYIISLQSQYFDALANIMIIQLPAYVNGVYNIKGVYFTQRPKAAAEGGLFTSNLANRREIYPLYGGPNPFTGGSYNPGEDYSPGSGANEVPVRGLCPWGQNSFVSGNSWASFPSEYKRALQLNGSSNSVDSGQSLNEDEQFRGWCYEEQTGRLFITRKYCDTVDLGDSQANGNCENSDKPWHPLPDATNTEETLSRAAWGVLVEFYPIGTSQHLYSSAAGTALANRGVLKGMTPGNDFYYLKKLERFELLGIPQIYYEPLYCNSNMEKMVPGIFKLPTNSTNHRTSFETAGYSLKLSAGADTIVDLDTWANSTRAVVFNKRVINSGGVKTVEKNIILEDIFSSHEFMCCQRLGQTVSNPDHCCSSFGTLSGTKYTCKLPLKTNLNVYFNRFVSGEGSEPTLTDQMRLTDSDFDPQTGYPRNDESVYDKLVKLGEEYCDSKKVFSGSAIGKFGLKPVPARGVFQFDQADIPRGIVSEVSDAQAPTSTASGSEYEGFKGFVRFNEGRRWNHHFYCGSVR